MNEKTGGERMAMGAMSRADRSVWVWDRSLVVQTQVIERVASLLCID